MCRYSRMAARSSIAIAKETKYERASWATITPRTVPCIGKPAHYPSWHDHHRTRSNVRGSGVDAYSPWHGHGWAWGSAATGLYTAEGKVGTTYVHPGNRYN